MSEYSTLPSFPVDDATLLAVEHALGGSLTVEDGQPILVGADYSLWDLLEFLSGYDPDKSVPIGDGVYEYVGGPIYHPDDVIRALVAEVRRLRKGL